jgi:hypothetical protein
VLFVDENLYTGYVSTQKAIQSIKKTLHFANRASIFPSKHTSIPWDAVLTLGIVYFMTVILDLGNLWNSRCSMFATLLVWYFFVNLAATKISKKKLVIFAFSIQASYM